MNKVILTEKLDELMLANWAAFVNRELLIKQTLQFARENEYKTATTQKEISNQIKISVTKFCLKTNEMWIEFSIPQDGGVLIGTHIGVFNLNGELNLTESMGTLLKQRQASEP